MLGPHPRPLLRDLGAALRQDATDLLARARARLHRWWFGGEAPSAPGSGPTADPSVAEPGDGMEACHVSDPCDVCWPNDGGAK